MPKSISKAVIFNLLKELIKYRDWLLFIVFVLRKYPVCLVCGMAECYYSLRIGVLVYNK
jgi:hypothetical protein